MAPLIQPVVNLIGMLVAIGVIVVVAVSVAAMLMRQFRFLSGLFALDNTNFDKSDGDFLP
jgi:hypothetical protein